MSTSTARIEANRRNAQLSTGPKTEAGKAASRGNALKHGLTATVVDLPPDHALHQGGNPAWDGWVGGQVGQVMGQIDRAQRIEVQLREEAVARANTLWDNDRQVEAAHLGATIERDPSRVALLLQQSPHGCDWLTERWQGLVRVAEAGTLWTDEQGKLALDMLGVPLLTRTGFPTGTAPADQARLARKVLADLEAQRLLVQPADAIARKLAATDSRDLPTPELARVRRYEATLHRRLRWLLAGDTAPAASTSPAVANEANPVVATKPAPAEPAPAPTPEPASQPARRRPDPIKEARRDRKNRRKQRQRQRTG